MIQTQQKQKLTEIEYKELQAIFDFYNEKLFDNKLSQCLITLQRQPGSVGFFAPRQFSARGNDSTTDEIALNPDAFQNLSDEQILSNLVHDMCHIWDYYYGQKSKPTYHSKPWAEIMTAIGLTPVSTDNPGHGIRYSVTHEIQSNGLFKKVTNKLLSKGFKFNWQSKPFVAEEIELNDEASEPIKKKNSRTKYSCSTCELNAWARSGANLVCGDCQQVMEVSF